MGEAQSAGRRRLDARAAWSLGRRHWLRLLLPVVVAVLAGGAISMLQPKVYESRGDVFFDLSSSDSSSSDPARAARTQAALALSSLVVDKAAVALRVPSDELARDIDVIPSTVVNQLTFVGRGKTPEFAVAIVQAEQAAYDETLRDQLSGASTATLQPLEDLRNRLVGQLNDANAALAAKPKDATLSARRNDLSQQLADVTTRELDARSSASGVSTQQRIIEAPQPAVKVAPKPSRTVALAAVLGLLAGLALLWRAAVGNRSPAQQVEAALDRPLLGRLPFPGDNTAAQEEEFAIRIGLQLASETRVVALLPIGRAGVSPAVVRGVGAALLRLGGDVVAVDADLRFARLSRELALDREPGVLQVAAGDADPRLNVRRMSAGSDGATIGFLPRGAVKPDALLALNSRSLHRIVQQLRGDPEGIVLLVCPAPEQRADLAALLVESDAVLICWDGREVADLQMVAGFTESAPEKVLGAVLDRSAARGLTPSVLTASHRRGGAQSGDRLPGSRSKVGPALSVEALAPNSSPSSDVGPANDESVDAAKRPTSDVRAKRSR